MAQLDCRMARMVANADAALALAEHLREHPPRNAGLARHLAESLRRLEVLRGALGAAGIRLPTRKLGEPNPEEAAPLDPRDPWRIGRIARAAGVHPSTVRRWLLGARGELRDRWEVMRAGAAPAAFTLQEARAILSLGGREHLAWELERRPREAVKSRGKRSPDAP